MEILEIIGYWLFGASMGAVLAIIVSFLLKDKLSERKIARQEETIEELEEALHSYKMADNANKGKVMKVEREAEMEAAIGEFIVLMKAGKSPMDAIKEVAVKYPGTALRLAKKYGLGI